MKGILTLRMVPPHWWRETDRPSGPSFLDVYYRSLWEHWPLSSRIISCLMIWLLLPARICRDGLICWRMNFNPGAYRAMRQHMRSGSRPEHYLWAPTRKGLHKLLNAGAFPLSRSVLKNKLLFSAHCARNALPHPETLAAEAGGEEVASLIDRREALVVKPNFSSHGRGVKLWVRKDADWISDRNERLSRAAMIAHVRESLARGDIVQRRLSAHPELTRLSPGVLPSLRIITCLSETGEPEVTDVVLRLAGSGDRPVDNFKAGGIAAFVDADGRVRRALTGHREGYRAIVRHPVTGARIEGFVVPCLAEAKALVICAHRSLGTGLTVVGWDVGLTDEGPSLIEGNWNPGGESLQLPQGEGLAARRLGELFRFHLERLPPATWSFASPVQFGLR